MDVDRSGVDRPVPKESFDGQEVGAILIQVGAKSMAEGMGSKSFIPAQSLSVGYKLIGERLWRIRFVRFHGRREQPGHGSAAGKPVIGKDIEGLFGEDGISVLAVLGMSDMNAHGFPVNIFIPQGTDFTDPETGGIQKNDHGSFLFVGNGVDVLQDLVSGRNKREKGFKPSHRKLSRIPGFVKNIHGEKAQLGDGSIDGAVREGSIFLKPEDIVPEFLPRNILRLFVKDVGKIVEVRADISTVSNQGMVSKTAKGKHFLIRIKIFVHKRPPK